MMEKLHNKLNNVPKAEPRSLLCSNNDVNRGSALGFNPATDLPIEPLSEESITAVIDFAKILKRIHIRLVMEGYVIQDGKIYKP